MQSLRKDLMICARQIRFSQCIFTHDSFHFQCNVGSAQKNNVLTCSVTSRVHFDEELVGRHTEVRPVVRWQHHGLRITIYLPLPMAAGSITFLSARQPALMQHGRKKKGEEPIARLKQRKTPFQRKTMHENTPLQSKSERDR